MNIDPEQALKDANNKFSRRFRSIEDKLSLKNSAPIHSNLAEMDALWDEVKRDEK